MIKGRVGMRKRVPALASQECCHQRGCYVTARLCLSEGPEGKRSKYEACADVSAKCAATEQQMLQTVQSVHVAKWTDSLSAKLRWRHENAR